MSTTATVRGQEVEDQGESYTFTVDAALLKELGERLVGKPFVALAELVKNAYDADATRVRIKFERNAIEVADNGDGMSRGDFKNFWMRVGTTHKQEIAETTLFGRKVSGSKGVGRLAVQFLGSSLNLWSVSRSNEEEAFRAHVDWHTAQRTKELVNAGATVFRANCNDALPPDFSHGTRVRIEGLNQEWSEDMFERLATELWFLRPPKQLLDVVQAKDDFDIRVEGVSDDILAAFDKKLDQAFASWTAEIKGDIANGRNGNEASVTIKLKGRDKPQTTTFRLPNGALDGATFRIRVYKLTGKQSGGIAVKDARDYFRKFGGVHIYDQGFRLPYYGGEGDDWLGLEYDHSHRLILSKLVPDELRGEGDLRFLPTNGRVFGIVKVSTNHERAVASVEQREKGAHLNVQVTRDRLIDNEAMGDLRTLVRWSLDYYAYLASAKKYQEDELGGARPLKPTEPVFDEIRERLSTLAQATPGAAAALRTIDTRIIELFSIEKDRERRFHRERILLGALATAGMGAIALEHELGKEITALRAVIGELSSQSANREFAGVKLGLESLLKRITDARKLLSPLMEPDNRDLEASMRLKPVVEGVIADLRPLLRSAKVEVGEIDEDIRLPKATQAAWAAILQNVVVNAVNATIDTPAKRIRISAQPSGGNRVSLLVEDNGVGVDLEDAPTLFEPFERRLELSEDRKRLGLGGVGLGLTIVRMVAQSVGCEARFVRPSSGMTTAFELAWKREDAKSSNSNTHHRRRA